MKRYLILIFILSISIFIVGFQITNTNQTVEEPEIPLTDMEPNTGPISYSINVLLLTDNPEMNSQSIYQHLEQSLVPNLNIYIETIDAEISLKQYDLVYLDTGLSANSQFQITESALIEYVNQGGILFLSHEYLEHLPKEFLGISGVHKAETVAMDFTYPAVRPNLTGLQDTWHLFASDYQQYRGLNPDYHINYEYAAKVNTATTLVEQDGLAYLLANQYGKGTVIWANNFLPNEQFITRFDMISEDNQKYFHFGYASANYLFSTELVKFVSKEKYGFSLSKSHGSYGRPGLSWQNHYESLSSFPIDSMIKWIDILEEHNQIPSYSLIRSSYPWGQWVSSISIHINEGTDSEPIFAGETEDSFYSSGQRLTSSKDYLTFGSYPQYSSLLADLDQPVRAYPQVTDWNNNGKKDLLIGQHNGRIYFLENLGTDEKPLFEKKEQVLLSNGTPLEVSKAAAPLIYDFNGNSLNDILVGDEKGRITVFLNTGTREQARLTNHGFLRVDGQPLQVSGSATPFIVDWNNDGIDDLLVGESSGQVILFPGYLDNDQLSFKNGEPLKTSTDYVKVNRHASPFAVDWNNNGQLDLLIGTGDGRIKLYLRDKDNLTDSGYINGENRNFFGTNHIDIGNNAVPIIVDWNNDGKKDLLIGQLEYGIPYAIDSEFFPHKESLSKNIQYAKDKYVPLVPHIYIHEFKNNEMEIREIKLHKQAFNSLGIPWTDDMGANHHTWRISREEPSRTFKNLTDAGIWWNFGFNPPNVGSAPRDGKEFLWVIPFLYPQEDLILFSPAPHALNYSQTWESMAHFDIPLTYFEHIEHSLYRGTKHYDNLMLTINFMNDFKDRHEYNFMTEEQMARAMLNTFHTELNIIIEEDTLQIHPDTKNVPELAKEYTGTLGLKIELGETYSNKDIDTSSFFYTHKDQGYYIGLAEPTTISFVDNSTMNDQFHIIRSNGPLNITQTENGFILESTTRGMQEVKFYSPIPVTLSGPDLKIIKEGNFYTFTHFGDTISVHIDYELR